LWDQAVKKEVDDAVEKAKKGSIPPADALWKNIYLDTLGSKMKGLDSKTHIQL
jgi:pyruvate dehydrogenase E1 component alpha subunit